MGKSLHQPWVCTSPSLLQCFRMLRDATRWLMWNKLRFQFCAAALLVGSPAIFPSWVKAKPFPLSFSPLGHPSTVPAEQGIEPAPRCAVLFQGVDVVQGCPQLHAPLWPAAFLFPMAAAHLKQSQITTSSLISWYYFLQETQHIPSQDKRPKPKHRRSFRTSGNTSLWGWSSTGLSRKAVESLSLGIIKSPLDRVLGSWLGLALHEQSRRRCPQTSLSTPAIQWPSRAVWGWTFTAHSSAGWERAWAGDKHCFYPKTFPTHRVTSSFAVKLSHSSFCSTRTPPSFLLSNWLK